MDINCAINLKMECKNCLASINNNKGKHSKNPKYRTPPPHLNDPKTKHGQQLQRRPVFPQAGGHISKRPS